MQDEKDRFWSKVAVTSEGSCWLWTASVEPFGYPVFYLSGGRKMRGHRYSLQLKLGRPIAAGMIACHTCHVPSCVNPQHLYEGTHASNSDDKVRAERQMRGSGSTHSHLTDGDVICIIQRYAAGGVSQRALAREFSVSQSEISRMITGRSWKHIGRQLMAQLVGVAA